VDGYTKFISPLKLPEYLAAGRPVVGADIEPLRPFDDLIRIARTEEEWSEALEQSLRPEAHAAEEYARRRARAKAMDWKILVKQLAFVICDRLDPALAGAFREPESLK
jgi:hypothetical protein